MKKLLSAVAVAFLAFAAAMGSGPAAQAAEGDLGISLQVIQGPEDSSSDLNKNNKLWFVIAPGESGEREFQIRSASDSPQKIHLGIGGQVRLNGVLQFDAEATTPVGDWAIFSKNDFVLDARETETLKFSINVPKGTAIQTLEPSLLIAASGIADDDAQYKIPTALQFSQSIFLGVGTSDQFLTQFTIDDVSGINTNSGHMLLVKLSNTGKTPIALTGDLQLSSLTFESETIGPLKFISDTIEPGKSIDVMLPADEGVVEGKWKILVRASQGSIQETKTFEKDITFAGTNYTMLAGFSGAIILASIILALVAIRTLRSIKTKQDALAAEKAAEAARVAALERALEELQAKAAKPKRKPAAKQRGFRELG